MTAEPSSIRLSSVCSGVAYSARKKSRTACSASVCGESSLQHGQFEPAFCDAEADEIVRGKAAGNDALPNRKRVETAASDVDHKYVVIYRAEVDAVKFKASDGATSHGVDECCPEARRKSHDVRIEIA